jgi:TonB family protein
MRPLIPILAILFGCPFVLAHDGSNEFRALIQKTEQNASLTTPDSQPFHLKLEVADARNEHPEFNAGIEIWWSAPDKWRREIKSSIFSQMAVRDGKSYSESNSSDYLPWWLHNLVAEALDPLPVEELQNLRLALKGSPDNSCIKWDVVFAQDTDRIGISNSICFNSDGTVKHVFSRTAEAEFADYRPFGHKRVARSIEAWTHTQDRKNVDLKGRVTLLEPLRESGSLMTVANDTGLSSRIRFVSVPQSALEEYKLYVPPMQWPVIHNFPDSGMMTINIKIDRNGIVREVGSAISPNVVLSDPAREQLQNWKFKPFLVDGSPVQVNTDFAFKFKTKMEPYGAKGADIPAVPSIQRINKSRELSDLQTGGNKPFHLHASFQYAQDVPGSYDETWLAPTRWHREATLNSLSVIESQDGDHLYRKFIGSSFSPRKIDDFLDELDGHLPKTDGSFQEGDWGQSAVQWNGADMLRVARGQVDSNNNPITGQAYWFDSVGLLHGAYVEPRTSTYADFVEWNGMQVPRNIEVSEKDVAILRIRVEKVESPVAVADSMFVIEGVKPQPVFDPEHYDGPEFVQPQPIFRATPVDPHVGHGTVLVDVDLDRHGHVRIAHVRQGASQALDDAAVQAAMQWEFTPMILHGRIVPGHTTLSFKF